MATDYDWHPDAATGGSVFKVETRNLGWWVFLAILVSIFIHFVLFIVLSRWEQTKRDNETEDYRITLAEQPTIDRSTLDDLLAQSQPILDTVVKPEAFVEPEIKEFDASDIDELPTDVVKLLPGQTPKFSIPAMPKLSAAALDSGADDLNLAAADSLNDDLAAMRDKLLQENKQVSVDQLVVKVNENDLDRLGSDLLDKEAKKAIEMMGKERGSEFAGGYSSLDQLISRTGGGLAAGFQGKTLLPTDILFASNQATLQEGSKIALVKLAYLISINEDATFIIEGHTDSFGTEEHNLNLSRQRAQSVRDWIVNELQIPTRNVRVIGRGESKPLVSTEGTVEQQAINRRVEIEIRKPR